VATYSGARIDQINSLISRFTYDRDQFPATVGGGMTVAAGRAAGVMRWRIESAETETGRLRVERGGKGPGRVRSGTMLQSISQGGHFVNITTLGTKVRAEFGYINSPPPYTEAQEYTSYSISGKLLAHQFGFNAFMVNVYTDIANAWKELDEDAKAGKFQRRADRYQSRGYSLLLDYEQSAANYAAGIDE
jgi:hypothetical protein